MLGVAIANALMMASDAHEKAGDRYEGQPYSKHLVAVLAVLFEFYVVDEDILVAAPLHDAIEDTDTTKEQIEAKFGPRVARLVDAVSDPPGYPNRKTRKAAAYPRMLREPGAVKLKLADRIANVRSCWDVAKADKQNKSLLGMYKKEYGGFRKALRRDDIDEVETRMWEELDRLLAWTP